MVGLLWGVAVLNYLDRLMIASMRGPIRDSIPMSDAQFGLLTAVFLWSYGILSPFGGYLGDRFSRTKLICASLLVWSVVTALCGCARTYGELLALRAVMGVSEAFYIPAALALISDYHRGATRSLATGVHMSGIYMGAALGGIGGFLAESMGWRHGFLVFGAVGIGYFLILNLFLKDAPALPSIVSERGEPISFLPALRTLGSSTGFWIIFAVNAVVGTTNWCVNGWLPTYMQEHFRLSLGVAGLSATGYIQAAAFPGVLFGGWLADRWSRTHPGGRFLVTAIGFAVAAPCLFLATSTTIFTLATGVLLVYGFWRSFIDANLMPILRQLVDERYSATGYGILNFSGCMIGGGMVYAGGILRDASIGIAVVFQGLAVGLLLVSAVLFLVGRRRGWNARQTRPASMEAIVGEIP